MVSGFYNLANQTSYTGSTPVQGQNQSYTATESSSPAFGLAGAGSFSVSAIDPARLTYLGREFILDGTLPPTLPAPQVFSNPGTFNYVAPSVGSAISVQCWGAGGGGASGAGAGTTGCLFDKLYLTKIRAPHVPGSRHLSLGYARHVLITMIWARVRESPTRSRLKMRRTNDALPTNHLRRSLHFFRQFKFNHLKQEQTLLQ